ncbi:unnamed protein product [Closterium sp. NIES-53]
MATPSVLTFDAEGRAVDFEVWLDDLQLFLQCDRADGLSLSILPLVSLLPRLLLLTAQSAHIARYSSPATAALSRLFLPYLFPDLAAFPTVADLITHLRTSDARYRAALPTEFCAKNPPPLYLTLYYVVTRLPDSLRVVRDHFLSVCPTSSFASRHRSQRSRLHALLQSLTPFSSFQSLVHAFLLRRFPSSPSPSHRALMSQHVPGS